MIDVCRRGKLPIAPAAWRQNVVLPWLNVELLYEAAGWTVVYDNPGYNESHGATFTFTSR